MEVATRVQMVLGDRQRRLDIRMEQLQQDMERKTKQIETDLALEVRRVQDQYKMWAVLLPPVLPLALAVIVFAVRRSREREGVAETRLHKNS
jgi:ABC-2 type transport system permease protein